RANGLCSIICKSLSTFFIGTNDLFTAWKTYGATRPASNWKRPQRADCVLIEVLLLSTRFGLVPVLIKHLDQPISLATAGLLDLGLSPRPLDQVSERAWHPAVPLQKSE